MLINVPQYIDVEDKVAGPLTMKQLGWFIALGIILIILWNVLPIILFFMIGIPLAIIFSAMAFFKPYGQPMIDFLMHGVLFFFRPKVYVWKRNAQNFINIPQTYKKTSETFVAEKHLTSESLKGLAELLDSEGMNHNKDVDEILKKQPVKKS